MNVDKYLYLLEDFNLNVSQKRRMIRFIVNLVDKTGGTDDYEELINKPTIDGIALDKNTTSKILKLVKEDNLKTINGKPITGEGNIQTDIEVIEKGTSDTTISIDSNKFYKWSTVASLNITLNKVADETIYNEYMFEFVSGETATELTIAPEVKWINGKPVIMANTTYQVSIVNNIAVIGGAK